jgi:HAD superfamily hydrolase (TIGR01484 family)
MTPPIRPMLADVDGTLVTRDKVLTDRAIEAVHALHAANILFAITSGRPPRGMSMLIQPLQLRTPIAAFNGGLFVNPDMSTIEQHVISPRVVAPAIALLESFGLDVWLYRGADWFVRDLDGPHVDREALTVQFRPTPVTDFDDLTEDIAKIVGVGDDHDKVAAAASAAHQKFGDHVSATRSQPYYLDLTHPHANKGTVVQWRTLMGRLQIDAHGPAGVAERLRQVDHAVVADHRLRHDHRPRRRIGQPLVDLRQPPVRQHRPRHPQRVRPARPHRLRGSSPGPAAAPRPPPWSSDAAPPPGPSASPDR